jgi:hypothetical protein
MFSIILATGIQENWPLITWNDHLTILQFLFGPVDKSALDNQEWICKSYSGSAQSISVGQRRVPVVVKSLV